MQHAASQVRDRSRRGVDEYPFRIITSQEPIVFEPVIRTEQEAVHHTGFETEPAFVSETNGFVYQGVGLEFGICHHRVEALARTELPGQDHVAVTELAEPGPRSCVSMRKGPATVTERGIGPDLSPCLVRDSRMDACGRKDHGLEALRLEKLADHLPEDKQRFVPLNQEALRHGATVAREQLEAVTG